MALNPTRAATLAPVLNGALHAGCFRGGFWTAQQTPADAAAADTAASHDGALLDARALDARAEDAGADGDVNVGPGPQIAIRSPNNGNDLTTHLDSVTVAGTCSPDVVQLGTSLGLIDDGDCSDGTWSLHPLALDYPPGARVFDVAVADAAGQQASDRIRVTYAYLRLAGGNSAVYRRRDPTRINGTCSPRVASLEVNLGTVVDGDCSDGQFAVEVGFAGGEGVYTLTATGRDSLGRGETVDLRVHYDITPPEPPVLLETFPPSPSDDNFPLVRGDAEAATGIQLFADAACSEALTPGTATWDQAFWSSGLRIAVTDNSLNRIHARASDRAGNISACSTQVFEYRDRTPLALPACDQQVGQDLSFAELQVILDRAEQNRALYLGDGLVTICLANGITVSTGSAAEGQRLRIPGSDFRLVAPAGRATLHNQRLDTLPSAAVAQGVLEISGQSNVGLANLALIADGDASVGLRVEDARVVYLRDLEVRAAEQALSMPVEPTAVWLAEVHGCQLTARTAWHTRRLRARLVDQSVLSFKGGFGLDLQNSDILVGALRDCLISSDDPTTGGVGLRLWSANRSVSIQRMSGCTLRRGPDATTVSGSALSFNLYDDDATYVRTADVVGNRFCTAGAGDWVSLLDPGGLPTTPYDPQNNAATNGATSFPWGDADDAASNPGYNLQTQWGGACP